MTWNELAKQVFPDMSDGQAGYALWNWTCFPFGSPGLVASQLCEAKVMIESGLSPDDVIWEQMKEASRDADQ